MTNHQIDCNPELPSLTLQYPEDGPQLNGWIFNTIKPYINGRVLELESRLGSMASLFVEHNIPIHLSDAYKTNRDKLRERFASTQVIKGIYNLNSQALDFLTINHSIHNVFNTIIAVNLTEHGFYNKPTILIANLLLKRSGTLMIILPANTTLYHGINGGLEELKQYNRSHLQILLPQTFKVLKVRYFTLTGNLKNDQNEQLGLSMLVIARKLQDPVLA